MFLKEGIFFRFGILHNNNKIESYKVTFSVR
jgi:hypothetical protein